MEDESVQSACSFLKDPLSINDLIANGTTFEIEAKFNEGFTDEIYDELNMGSDDEDEDKPSNPIDQTLLLSPWTKPFEELKQHMEKINDYMWKKVTKEGIESSPIVPPNARVSIRYNAYWEGEGVPFDSSYLRGSVYSFYTGHNAILEGLESAVCTMRKGEHSQFVLSYHLLFREMGCPPRVKPKADGFFIIELVNFIEIGDINAEQQIPEQDRNKYTIIIKKIRDIHLKGLDFFDQGMYRNACSAFEKAMNLLKFCQLNSEEEEKEQRELLLKLYTNLAVCYIKTNNPSRTCIMCKEIRHLTSNKPPCKAVFQEGRALLMLGEYSAARTLLIQAQNMEPHNVKISNELKVLDDRYRKYKESESKIWSKAFGIIKENGEKPAEVSKKHDDGMSFIEREILKLLRGFKDNEDEVNFKLPTGLTNDEIKTVDALAKSLDLKLTLSPLDPDAHIVTKKIN